MTNSPVNVGFYGFGKMAQAIWSGVCDRGLIQPEHVYFYRRNKDEANALANQYGIQYCTPQALVEHCDIIFLCVKPQGITEVLRSLQNDYDASVLQEKCWVSIIAGTPIATFQHFLGEQTSIVRVMPNTPCLLQQGMSGITWSTAVTHEQKQLIHAMFSSVGRVVECTEHLQHVITGMSGSGPAFFYQLASHIAKLGSEAGLSPEDALLLIAQTLIGAGHMLRDTTKTPEELIHQVVSPGGTTEAGLSVLHDRQLGDHLQDVVKRAIERSIELGKGA